MLTHKDSEGTLGAGTTSLQEVPGGKRNFDYRYAWLKDAGMIVSALTRPGSNGVEERRLLKFIFKLERLKEEKDVLFAPMYTLDQNLVPQKQEIQLKGYHNSRPVTTGNTSRTQLQLGTTANVLLAAKLIYNKYKTKEHGSVVAETADYLAENRHKEGHGIWEEGKMRYTASKVITAVGLMFIAEHNLFQLDSEKEGAFLAGSLWMAQYYVYLKEFN